MTTSTKTLSEPPKPIDLKKNTAAETDDYVPLNEKDVIKTEKYKWLFWEFETEIIWKNVLLLGTWHALAIYFALTLDYTHYGKIIYFFAISFVTGFGVTGGVHRYYTHRSFKANLPLRALMVFCYTLAGQNTIIEWVKDHKVHHKYTETIADPHNAKRGFFFSHIGWLLMKKHPEVIRRGKQIDFSYLYEDPLVVFQHKNFWWFKPLVCFVLPTVAAPYIYGETWIDSIKLVCFVRYIFCLNCTWSVNSFAHYFGSKPYDKDIKPVENLWVAFFATGEGYHNYHHTFPWDYRAAELGSRMNFTTMCLNFFHAIGWAYDMKFSNLDMVKKVIEKSGDGTHFKWGHEIPYEKVKQLQKK